MAIRTRSDILVLDSNAEEKNATPHQASAKRKWLLRGLKVAVFLVVVWFIGDTMRTGINDLWNSRQPLEFHAGWLSLAGVLYFVGMMPCAVFWHRILWALGQRPTFFESLRAYHIGHLGKYVPGKALVVVLRSSLVKGPRVDPAIAAASVFLETFTMMAVGAGL
ncbi:MAG: flippase-like domain-containing protein, partial [Planctomycetales bacterium]|nr:flippase-like domain-containing protein [Planctomycetales bacterium]